MLVNNAGIWVAGSVEDVTPDAWRRGMSVNLDSVYLGTRQALAQALLDRCAQLDLEALATDVEKFLFDANGRLGVTRFPQLIRQHWLAR